MVIVRLPRGMSVVRPGSHCLSCGEPIAWYDNVPLVSYLLLRGRCRRCGARFSPRYFLVELLGATLAAATFLHAASPDPVDHLARFVAEFAFAAFLVAVAFIDLDTWIIPNRLTYPALPVLGAAAVLTGRLSGPDALIGAMAGFGILGGVIVAYRLVTGKQGMGWGDAKLLAVLGAFLGWQALPALLFLAAIQGLLAALVLLAARRMPEGPPRAYVGISDQEEQDEDPEPEPERPSSWRTAPLPFGPFLALAGLELLFFFDRFVRWLGWA